MVFGNVRADVSHLIAITPPLSISTEPCACIRELLLGSSAFLVPVVSRCCDQRRTPQANDTHSIIHCLGYRGNFFLWTFHNGLFVGLGLSRPCMWSIATAFVLDAVTGFNIYRLVV